MKHNDALYTWTCTAAAHFVLRRKRAVTRSDIKAVPRGVPFVFKRINLLYFVPVLNSTFIHLQETKALPRLWRATRANNAPREEITFFKVKFYKILRISLS